MGTMSFRFGGAAVAAALVFCLLPAPTAATTCNGADPAVVSVVVTGKQSSNGLDRYTLRAKVVNLGRSAQVSNTLQFVDIYKGSAKKDSRGIPPLKAGQSYTFDYIATRSTQAGHQTTALSFRMDVRSPHGSQDCNTGNGITMIRF